MTHMTFDPPRTRNACACAELGGAELEGEAGRVIDARVWPYLVPGEHERAPSFHAVSST